MELFLPGLFVLLISAIFVFLVVPRMGTVVLGVVSLLTLVLVLLHHSYLFGTEYRLSTWQNSLGAYAPFVVLGFAILAVLVVAISFISGGKTTTPVELLQTSVTNAMKNMPTAASATNSLTSTINRSLNSAKSFIPALGFKASDV